MATPRSIEGFEKATAAAMAVLSDIETKLDTATGDEEIQLLEDKADAEVDLGVLEQKFEEFKVKSEEVKPEPEPEPEQEEVKPEPTPELEEFKAKAEEVKPEPEPEQEEVKPEPTPELEGSKLDEILVLTAAPGVGYMVNPYTHQKFTEGNYAKVIADKWTLSQVNAGILTE